MQIIVLSPEAVFWRCSVKKVFLKMPSGKLAFRPTTLLKGDSNTGVFFGRFCEVSQTAFFIEHPPVVVSELQKNTFCNEKWLHQ